jgi:CelD/BcsL family acetyltransferase involved in cellulose biosynthesis
MHMLRLGYQGVEFLETGRITLPMPQEQWAFVFAVREGKVDLNDALTRAGELERSVEDLLESRRRNFREQLRRRSRGLARAGATFRLADAESLERDLDTLFSLHRARWEGRPSAFAHDDFHRDVARAALGRGWLRLWLLELDGQPLAAWHGFHVGGVTCYYQAGRDPAYGKWSAGFVLLAHTLREAIGEGATEYRFGRGGEPFKYRFTSDDPGLESVVVSHGPRGRAAVALASAARRVRR